MFSTIKQKIRANTFSVDDVAPACRPIWTEPLSDSVAKRFMRKVLFLPDSAKPVTNALYDDLLSLSPSLKRSALASPDTVVSRRNPLIDAVGIAFSQHRPLTLSPDCIWLVIEQGFAHHVIENAETLRHRLVRHDGSREITSNISELSLAAFEGAIADISAQIREASDPVLHETLICDFSTTTPAIRTASEIALMDCYSSYFTYAMNCVCGIPKITVTGSVEDWQRIRERVEVLETYRLRWWVRRLRPILDEFIRTVEGTPNLQFWQAIYKPKEAYATTTVTGWIADLFPYLGNSPGRRRNHVFKYEREDWAIPVEHGVNSVMGGEPGAGRGAGIDSFPFGLASVPVKLLLRNEAKGSFDLVGGFLAVEQDAKSLSLSPLIGWCVAERAPASPVLVS